jgi:hypothetical protein
VYDRIKSRRRCDFHVGAGYISVISCDVMESPVAAPFKALAKAVVNAE